MLSKTTYADFLTKICGYAPQLIAYFQASAGAYFGVGVEVTTAPDAWGNGNPGFDGMDLGEVPYKTMSPSGYVQLKNWQAFAKLGIDSFECPSGFWDGANMDMPGYHGRVRLRR